MKLFARCTVIPVGSQIYMKMPDIIDYIVASTEDIFNHIRNCANLSFTEILSPTGMKTYKTSYLSNEKNYVRKSDIGKLVQIFYIIHSNDVSFSLIKIQNIYLSSLISINDHISQDILDRYNMIREYAKKCSKYGNGYPTGLGYLWYAKNTYNLGLSMDEALRYMDRLQLYHNESVGYMFIYNCDRNLFIE